MDQKLPKLTETFLKYSRWTRGLAVAALFLVALVFIFGLYSTGRATLSEIATGLSKVIAQAVSFNDGFVYRRVLGALVDSGQASSVCLDHVDGKLLFAYPVSTETDGCEALIKQSSQSVSQIAVAQALSDPSGKRIGTLFLTSKIKVRDFIVQFLPVLIISSIFYLIMISFIQLLKGRALDPLLNFFDNLGSPTSGTFRYAEMQAVSEKFFDSVATERRKSQLESELARQRQRVRIAERVAHDIRSPLSAIRLVMNQVAHHDTDAVALLDRACERVNAIAEDILKGFHDEGSQSPAEQLSSGRHEAYGRTLNHKLDEVVASLRDMIELERRAFHQIQWQIEDPGIDITKYVAIDIKALHRILSNLLSNARDAMSGRGTIAISFRVLANQFVISIEDNGPGFPAEVLTNGGERPLTVGKAGGTGIGLHASLQTLRTFNGHLRLGESSRMGGAKVDVTLPI